VASFSIWGDGPRTRRSLYAERRGRACRHGQHPHFHLRLVTSIDTNLKVRASRNRHGSAHRRLESTIVSVAGIGQPLLSPFSESVNANSAQSNRVFSAVAGSNGSRYRVHVEVRGIRRQLTLARCAPQRQGGRGTTDGQGGPSQERRWYAVTARWAGRRAPETGGRRLHELMSVTMSSAIALPCRAARIVMIEPHRFCIVRMSTGVWCFDPMQVCRLRRLPTGERTIGRHVAGFGSSSPGRYFGWISRVNIPIGGTTSSPASVVFCR
jgi:hypothetical protein